MLIEDVLDLVKWPSLGDQNYRPVCMSACIDASLLTPAQALVALDQAGKLRYTVSQNVDGLHRRSGLPAERLVYVP